MFADDAVLFAENPLSLQLLLNDVEKYCKAWRLKINTNKTKVMVFENGRHTHHDFYIYEKKIEIVECFKYLGVYLYKNGKWNRSQSSIAQHASVSLHNMFIVNNQLDLRTKQKLELFDSTVSPILNYAAIVCG